MRTISCVSHGIIVMNAIYAINPHGLIEFCENWLNINTLWKRSIKSFVTNGVEIPTRKKMYLLSSPLFSDSFQVMSKKTVSNLWMKMNAEKNRKMLIIVNVNAKQIKELDAVTMCSHSPNLKTSKLVINTEMRGCCLRFGSLKWIKYENLLSKQRWRRQLFFFSSPLNLNSISRFLVCFCTISSSLALEILRISTDSLLCWNHSKSHLVCFESERAQLTFSYALAFALALARKTKCKR